MKINGTAVVVLGIVGVAVWYVTRQLSAAGVSTVAQNPAPLPSRQIGVGYLDPITGGLGIAPIRTDQATGDTLAPLGTDLLLPAIDPYDPSLFAVPDLESGASSGWDFTELE